MSLHLAGDKGSGCIGMRLYLNEEWARDGECRAATGVPEQVHFERKWEIALGQLEEALAWGVRQRGRPSTRYTAQGVEPWSHAQLALQLPEEEWHPVHWREGSRGRQSSRFAAVRVRSAARHVHGVAPGQEE